MTEIEKICLVIGIIAVTVGIMLIWYRLNELDKLFNEWRNHILKHDKYFTDVEWHRVDDLTKLAALDQRVRTLEEKLEAPEFPDPEDEEIII